MDYIQNHYCLPSPIVGFFDKQALALVAVVNSPFVIN